MRGDLIIIRSGSNKNFNMRHKLSLMKPFLKRYLRSKIYFQAVKAVLIFVLGENSCYSLDT